MTTIVVERVRTQWIGATRVDGADVYVNGRTLREATRNAEHALTLVGAPSAVRVVPQSDELDALTQARIQYDAALTDAVRALRARRVTWQDVATATGVPQARARQALDQAG